MILVATGCKCTDNRKPDVGKKDNTHDNQVAMLSEYKTQQQPIEQTLVKQAIVEVKSLSGHPITGKIIFTKVPTGIKIVANVDGLTPGKHGFHVHEFGDCGGKDGAAAGGHFNPTKSQHGGPDSPERHVGDLGNLEADAQGHAHYERVDQLISFEGANSILGLSIVIHADPDDYKTQPTGASGARVACGLIKVVKENP